MSLNFDHAAWMATLASAWEFLNYKGLVVLGLNALFGWATLSLFARQADAGKKTK